MPDNNQKKQPSSAGIGDFSLHNLNFAPQFLSPLPYILFQMAAHAHPKYDDLLHHVALYLRQPTHKIDMLIKPDTDMTWTVNAGITFEFADFDKGPLTAHQDGVNSEAPLTLDTMAVASFVYGMLRDAGRVDPYNMIQMAYSAHIVKQGHRSIDAPFLMRTHAIFNSAWEGQDFEKAVNDFEKTLITRLGPHERDDLTGLQPVVQDAFYNQTGARQFLALTFLNEQESAQQHAIIAVTSTKVDAIMYPKSFEDTLFVLQFLEKAYITPNLTSDIPGRAAMFAAQKNDLLHYSNWADRLVKKPTYSMLGPRPS